MSKMSFQLKFKEFLKSKDKSEDELDEDLDTSEDNVYCERYTKLWKRCEEIKSQNERLINNIYKIKRLSKKYIKHKKILIKRLTKHNDDYMKHDFPLFLEKDESTQNDIKSKNLLSKFTSNTTNTSSKAKKPKTNNRNESTSNSGTVGVVPKKPINPYLLFCQENRSSLQEIYLLKHKTEMTHQDLTKALAQQWHELTVTAKQVYYNLFNNDKVRYENEMKLFVANSAKDTTNELCD